MAAEALLSPTRGAGEPTSAAPKALGAGLGDSSHSQAGIILSPPGTSDASEPDMAAGGAPASPAVIPQQSPPEAPDAAGEPSPRDNPSPLAAPASPEEQDAPDEGAESGEAPVVQVGEVSLDVSASAVPVLRDLGFGGWFCELKVVEVVEEYLQFHDLQDSLVTLGHALTDAGLRVLGGKSSDGSEDEGEVPAKSAGVDEVPEAGSEFAPADIPGDDSRTRAKLFTCEFAVARAICEFNAGHR
ncbi:unnamed protein product, partial [Polarella glacialis]